MTLSKALGTAAVLAFALAVLPPDEAAAETVDLGGAADVDLLDIENGTDVEIDQEWTISDLKPSTDTIPYRPAGSLWEATATVELADGGIPVIPGFVARSDSDSYPVLWNVASPQAVDPSALPPAGSATGKFYFDVTGTAPTGVAFLDVEGELIEWRTPPG